MSKTSDTTSSPAARGRRRGNRSLRTLARKCVWWKPPEETLREPGLFIAHVMTFGGWDDALLLRSSFSEEELCAALREAPPGVFDARSWHYWHRVLGIWDVPPRPVRRIPGVPAAAPTSKLEWASEFQIDAEAS
jgi:hypothetical protein